MPEAPAPPLKRGPAPLPTSVISKMAEQGGGQQQGGGDPSQGLAQEIEKLSKQTMTVATLVKEQMPEGMPLIQKWVEIGKQLQEMQQQAAKNMKEGPQSGEAPPPNPAEGIPSGAGV